MENYELYSVSSCRLPVAGEKEREQGIREKGKRRSEKGRSE